ncbi:ribosomal protein S18 acetylase RimI-like enzyme [Chitinophaga skermanii]|uniref:Ribosomal protein S18 acetylase RimI-like enzyme n=1 Tax=Chitinophaga skermanii TaxID=331697 RepID=A0A327QM99_9BACT|nr:GNAT family N-acetyltransferase [Chitinophaga skermanii]RAJ05460.1 ribosomal protein S18 acetylase RimI-like enzyme [Chitinophaga skermanii]
MQTITIKPVNIHDLATIQTIGRQTFAETFAQHNDEHDMEAYLATSFSEEKLSSELNNPASYFFIAYEGNTPIGYLKLNTGLAQTEAQATDAMEIERIYVLAAYHGKKVGQLLYEQALTTAKALHASYLWLGVWEENKRAIGFYAKNGFVPFGQHVFKIGDDEQLDILMKKTLFDQ